MALAAETASPAVVVADGSSGAQSAVSWAAVIAGGVAAVAIDIASGRPWNRYRSVVGVAMVVIEPIRHDIHSPGGRLAHHRAVAIVRVGRLPGWQAANEVDEPAYRRSILPRYRPWFLGLGAGFNPSGRVCHVVGHIGSELGRARDLGCRR